MSHYLETSIELGRELAASPGAAEGRWLGDAMVGSSGAGMEVRRVECGSDLYGGSAGIGLALAHLALATRDDWLARCASSALAHAATSGPELAAKGLLSLYGGASGIALALIQGGGALQDEVLVRSGSELAEAIAGAVGKKSIDETDLIAGKAGILLALLAIESASGSNKLRSAAMSLANDLAHGNSGWWGLSPDDPSGIPLCGLGHGASGIGWALVAAGRRLKNSDLEQSGEGVLQFEDGHFDLWRGTWPDLRGRRDTGSAEPAWMDAWCHGAFGIGAVRWSLWASDRSASRLAVATAALWAARRSVVQAAADGPIADMTLCHGLAGAAELMLLAFEATGLEQHLNAARRVGDLILRLRERNRGEWTVGLPGGSDVPGLFLGRAGICTLFLRLHDPRAMKSPMLAGVN